MAYKKQIELLKQGKEVWNKWREENKSRIVQLNYAKLSHIDLSGVNLREANLNYVDFTDTNLSGVNFTNASLAGAEFRRSILNNAILNNTDLVYTIFRKTSFSKTNFFSCRLGGTIFSLTDLSTAKGLETIKIIGDCTIDFQTLQNSKNIPKEFLLKIGLPENYVNYLPDFYDASPLRLFPVFLSHSWANKDFAGKLYEALIKKGVLVWYDEKKLRAGDKIFEGLSKAINLYDKMILVCSKESLEESWWVDEEMNRIFKKERTYLKEKKKNVSLLIPITIDQHIFKWDGAKGESIRDKVIGDFSEWEDDVKFEKALNQLIDALNVDRGEENITSYL